MNEHIEAILFDVGGTLRGSRKTTEIEKIKFVEEILNILDSDLSPEDFAQLLTQRNDAYTKWSRDTHIEMDEIGQWTEWLLPDWPGEQISTLAYQLNPLWRQATAERLVYPETREVVLELFNRGYRLGVVSNTVSSFEVPGILEDLEISGCFDTVILSCVEGIRKPNPEIHKLAVERMEIEAEKCAYVGNKLDRDVYSPKKAGYSKSVILLDSKSNDQHNDDPFLIPDHYIKNLKDLLDIFPEKEERLNGDRIYNASLSTMWARKFPSLVEFFDASRRLGFEKVELNHSINSTMLSKVDLDQFQISSIHEPCPADISTGTLKDRDWLMSALDENSRREGVKAIKRSIDLATRLGVKSIVVHAGNVSFNMTPENNLRMLSDAGQSGAAEYQEIKQEMIEERSRMAPPRLDAVRRSLIELLEYTQSSDIRLGLENRYHYFDIPTIEEMEELLSLAGPAQLGFIYDVGHAQTLDSLGFFPHEEWLRKFSDRMIGIHFHDVRGVVDHYAPGLGEVDYEMIAPYLPEEAFRTFEVQPFNSPEEVKNSLKYLEKKGCISRIQKKDFNDADQI